jgi:hypothetical protein
MFRRGTETEQDPPIWGKNPHISDAFAPETAF